MTNERKKDFTMRITQANKTEMIVILYEMVLAYLDDAEDTFEDRDAFKESIKKTRECMNELMNSLDYQFELSQMLFRLYVFIGKTLTAAVAHHVREPLAGVRAIIEKLHSAYQEVSNQDHSGSVMENTQTVYAGLTYGRRSLNENCYSVVNRGYFA